MFGIYTLTEISQSVNEEHTLVNRIQRETGLLGGIGTKGIRREFTEADRAVLQKFIALRALGYSFKECGRIINEKHLPQDAKDSIMKRYITYCSKVNAIKETIGTAFTNK